MTRPLAAIALLTVAVGFGSPARAVEAQHGASLVTCVNPSSGTTWQINIDYDHNTVDANPASISTSTISWRDAKDGWNYSLDLKSGALTVILASATGGNMLFDKCKLGN
jgi:hypothetical protein